MHGECVDWGRGCRELRCQQPCPESFAAGEAPQPAGGLKHGSGGGDAALALGPPPRARAAPPRPEESAVSRIPRAPLWAVFTLPPASFSLQRSPRPRPAAGRHRRPGRGRAAAGSAGPHRKPQQPQPKRCWWRVRVPEAAEPKAEPRHGPRPVAPDEARRAEGTVVAEGLVPEAELGSQNKGLMSTEHLTPGLAMSSPWGVADLGERPSFLFRPPHFSSCPRKSKLRKVGPQKPRVCAPPTQGTAATQLQLSVACE